MIVYKYVHPDRIDVLESGFIRFTQAPALNDPFETLPNLQDVKAGFMEIGYRAIEKDRRQGVITPREAVEPKVKNKLIEFRDDFNATYAILSLSKRKNNLLMWSHYADSHSGFVIGFDSNNAFFKRRILNEVGSLEKVKYFKERAIVPAAVLDPLADHSGIDLAELFFFTKSDHWSYEDELRMVANPKTANKTIEVKGGDNIYLFKFPPESLREIIFGYRMPRNFKIKIAYLAASRYSNVKLFEAELSETKFDLEINAFEGR